MKLKKSILFVFLVILVILGCKEKPEAKIEAPTDQDLEEVNDAIIPDDTTVNAAGLGEEWSSWNKLYKGCFRNATFKNKIFLGPSSKDYLGTILSKDKSLTLDNLNVLSQDDWKLIANEGSQTNQCSLKETKKLSLEAIIGANLGGLPDSVKASLQNIDSIKVTSGDWQIDELLINPYLKFVKETPKLSDYYKSLTSPKHLVITKVVKVHGFTANVYTKREFNGGANITAAQGKISVGFGTGKSRILSVSSVNDFYIFGDLEKAKKITEEN